MKKLSMTIGGIVGGVGGMFLATYLAFRLMGDGQSGFAGVCFGIPVGGALGILIGWLIAKKLNLK